MDGGYRTRGPTGSSLFLFLFGYNHRTAHFNIRDENPIVIMLKAVTCEETAKKILVSHVYRPSFHKPHGFNSYLYILYILVQIQSEFNNLNEFISTSKHKDSLKTLLGSFNINHNTFIEYNSHTLNLTITRTGLCF